MARTRKYRYRRNYYFRRYRQVASRNYFKVKIEYYDKIQFGQNGNPARPIFLGPQVGPDYPSASIITLTDIPPDIIAPEFHQSPYIPNNFQYLLCLFLESNNIF